MKINADFGGETLNDRREYLKPGTQLTLTDGKIIEIEEVVGKGGTALTYYGRELVEGQEPVRILLKELFPDSDGIFRTDDGIIQGNGIAEKCLYQEMIEALYKEQELGNQIANKKIPDIYPMKEVVIDSATGNYYGLFYQCPPSLTLKQFVEKCENKLSLYGKLKIIRSLSRLVQTLHETGEYCHNDISMGNVLVSGSIINQVTDEYADWAMIEQELQVGLIDFSCAAELNWRGEVKFGSLNKKIAFHTDGFSAPEFYGDRRTKITKSADVYSVAACLWYLLTGNPIKTEYGYPILGYPEWEILERNIKDHDLFAMSGDMRLAFAKNPKEIPDNVISKIGQLLQRGLETQQKRDSSMEVFIRRLQEIIDLIEGTTVSGEELSKRLKKAYESNRNKLKNRYRILETMLPVAKRSNGQEEALLDLFMSGKSIYAIGPGGVGKTTTMFHTADLLYNTEGTDIPVYIELNRILMWNAEYGVDSKKYWLGEEERPMFIEQYMAGIYDGCAGQMVSRNDLIAGALRKQIESADPEGKRYIIFLDGLNEMAFSDHEEKQCFAAAINWYLNYGENISIVLTSRYDEGLITAPNLQRVQVNGLTDDSVKRSLKEELASGSITDEDYGKVMALDRDSNLWKCLKLPLFFHMFCQVEEKGKISSAGEILQAYFHGKKRSLDGSRTYSERVLGEEKYRELQFTEALSLEITRTLLVDVLLPKFGYSMMYLQKFFVEKDVAERMIERYLEEENAEYIAKRYEYDFDIHKALKRMKESGAEKILRYICENLGILAQESEGSYFFQHQYYRDYFAAVQIILMFNEIAELYDKKEISADENERMHDLLEYFASQKLPESVLMLCGECLGVHRTIPRFNGKQWKCAEQWDSLVDVILEICRVYPDRSQSFVRRKNKTPFLEQNLFDMLCTCRRYGTRADLSGIDLSYISLETCPVKNVIFSHVSGEEGIYANLTDTNIIEEQFKPEISFGIDESVPIRMHPDGTWCLVMSNRKLFLSKDIILKTHLEEREILGDEIRPLGYWDTIESAIYSEDGQIIGVLETTTEFDAKPWEDHCRNIYFYNRKTGKTYSAKLETRGTGWQHVLDCKWCGNSFVILQSGKLGEVIHTTVRLQDEQLMQEHREIQRGLALKNGKCFIVNKDHMLIHYSNRGVIYQVHTGQMIWFDMNAEWRCCTVDDYRNSVLAILNDGSVVRINVSTGEINTIRQSELFERAENVQISKESVYFVAENHLYQSDENLQTIRFIKVLPIPDVGKLAKFFAIRHVSVGGEYAAVNPGMIFRLSDGSVIKQWVQKESHKKLPRKVWIHPQQERIRISILDQETKVLYHFGVEEKGSIACIGYSFIELDDERIDAIYVESVSMRLAAFCKDKIQYYDLNSGKKVHEITDLDLYKTPIQDFELGEYAPKRYSIEAAVFSPDKKSLELNVLEYHEKQAALWTERRLVCLKTESRKKVIREIQTGLGSICRYDFLPKDILSGTDSGNRQQIYEHDKTWEEQKREIFEEWDYRDICSNDSNILTRFCDRLTKRFGKQTNKIELTIFEHGEYRCGMGKDGYFYWDADQKQLYELPGESMSVSHSGLFYGQIFPFDAGFIVVTDKKVTRYVENSEKKTMECYSLEYLPERYILGCHGSEQVRRRHRYSYLSNCDVQDKEDM